MKDETDYRTAINGQGHGVVLIKQENDTNEAFGYFKTIDEDMTLLSDQEEAEINAALNPF